MARLLRDALLSAETALPAAGASNYSSAINIGQKTADTITEQVDLRLTVPSTPSLVSTKTATFTFQDSADNISFAAIPELSALVVTGGSEGGAATARTVKLPASTRQYIRVSQAVEAAGGSSVAVKTTLELLH